MFRAPRASIWARFMWEPPFQLIMGFSIGPSSVGCMLSTSGKCVPSFKKNVFRTINSMRYVRYGALRIEPCNGFQNIVFVVLTTHLFNQQTKYTTDCTLKTTATSRAGGATEAVSRPEEWRRSSLFQTKHQPSLQKGYQKRTSVCIKLNKDSTTPSVRI